MKQPYILNKLITEPLDINLDCLHSLFDLLVWVRESENWTRNTPREMWRPGWSDLYGKIAQDNLYKFGFVNGTGPTTPEGTLWWILYQYDPRDSPNFKILNQNHRFYDGSLACCAKKDLEFVYDFYLEKYETGKINS